MLKVSPWKGVIHFGKRGKLNPRYIGPFKIIAKVGIIAYRLELPEQLSRVHSTFHVSNLKKCVSDETLAIPLDEIQVDDKLHFIEEPVEIMDCEFTFLADFIIVDYESDPRVPLILGRPFLRTARALIDVHGEEMILRDGDERLILNMRHDTSSYSNKPQKESINMIDIYNNSKLIASDSFPPGSDDTDFDPEGDLRLIEELLNNDPSSPLPLSHNPLSGSTTSSSPDHLLEEFTDELALITFPWEMMIFLLISNPILEK
ncbi:reverse transcriptase domain-containing protein [Tanacetum coccineum]|uniref:Reverse transcriptase domain-containing protein n=1 Tax=Tanacetum coccineum TaxID=301880 RepID=A0ABQ5GUS2_9ASTR